MQEIAAFQESGPLWAAIAEAAESLTRDHEAAERQLLAILQVAPGQQNALQLLIDAYRARGDMAGARIMLESMAAELSGLATIHYELGMLLADMGERERAVSALSRVVELEPKHPLAWRALGDLRAETGDARAAADAYSRQFTSSVMDLKTLEQVGAPNFEPMEVAEGVLHEYLNIYSTDLNALEMLGKIYMRAHHYESAEQMFTRALDLAPSFQGARAAYLSCLRQQLRPEDELKQLDIILKDDPDNVEYRRLKAAALSGSGHLQEAVRYCEQIIETESSQPRVWLTYAHTLRVAGRQEDCVAAYRKALKLDSKLAEAWWGLANLKIFHFTPSDIQKIQAALAREEAGSENAIFLHFALGKALEDQRTYEDSFHHYQLGNSLVRSQNPYNIEDVLESMAREGRRFGSGFFGAHAGGGCPSIDPIFILGLPRSGSTLVEQILASHSQVEGGGELPSLIAMARKLQARNEAPEDASAAALFEGEDLDALGREYLDGCRPFRKLGRPRFTDKMPSNFRLIGLICTILPNARIIDARRHPLACCFSNFKQIFPFRQGPSYDLHDMGRYYRAYIELLAHFDRVLPDRIHRVIYEDLVRDPEAETRRLLDYCGLPFEERCLRFYETERGIRTISSEQVRQPLYTDSLEQWRCYEPWLGPLKEALGPVLHAYPAVPDIL